MITSVETSTVGGKIRTFTLEIDNVHIELISFMIVKNNNEGICHNTYLCSGLHSKIQMKFPLIGSLARCRRTTKLLLNDDEYKRKITSLIRVNH